VSSLNITMWRKICSFNCHLSKLLIR